MKLHFDLSAQKLNSLYKKIYNYTNENWHNYAILSLVDFLEFEEYRTEMREIIEEHEILGFMNESSIQRRDEIRQICLNIFRLYYGNEAVKKIYSAF